MGTTKNRTYWPTSGGTVAFQPGWFRGHLTAFMQVNLGFGTDGPDNGPQNMSNPMVKPFQILGPTNNPYPGTICLTQLPLPVGANVKPGDLATIQIVETAQHGAALYSVRLPPVRAHLPHARWILVRCADVSSPATVRRHHLCRTWRLPHRPSQRDKLLQLDRHWLCRHLHNHLQRERHRSVHR